MTDSLPLWDGQEVPPDRDEWIGDFRYVHHTTPDGRRWETLHGPVVHDGTLGIGTALFVVEDDGTRTWAGFSWGPAPTAAGFVSEN